MDLKYTAEEASFRAEVRDFLAAELPTDIGNKMLTGRRMHKDDVVRWQKVLDRRSRGAAMWPERFGAAGWDVLQQHLFEEKGAAPAARSTGIPKNIISKLVLGP